METLGHLQISVTADLYTHVLKPRQRSASEAVDTLIFGPEDDGDEPAEDRVAAGHGYRVGYIAAGLT
jgi:hypothetical protein